MHHTFKLVRLNGGRGHAFMELDSEGRVIYARWIPPKTNIQVEL